MKVTVITLKPVHLIYSFFIIAADLVSKFNFVAYFVLSDKSIFFKDKEDADSDHIWGRFISKRKG